MATKKTTTSKRTTGTKSDETLKTPGGETHQVTRNPDDSLTTNAGMPIADDQNSLKMGARGPVLLEDHHLREKTTRFDHERIPERVVHARGSAAHGYFQPSRSMSHLTRALFLSDPKKKTPVFVRISTVAGGAGSADTPRDVRGFAVKFYTEEGNFDLVGNNIPVFFIQDSIKFPDLIHAVKMEPDRGFPQAATAHDTFWDFVSLMPESMHMLTWIMSDRTIPRSLRMIEGFGVHTFRLVNAQGKSTFVKWHWRPTIGCASTTWDEAVKLAGADPDFQRRDLHDAIESGDFPEWELCIQAFDDKKAAELQTKYQMDILDATKVIPEEFIPLEVIGKMVLNRNPDNHFAENDQVAFHPGHVVPGIDFTDDPLLQGRLFSYIDTQITRLGGPNFNQIPINAPKCPMRNFQRDGIHQHQVPTGRVAYEPQSLEPTQPRENPTAGFQSFAEPARDGAKKVRERPETFADHYSQARMFYRSMSEPEQRHMVSAFAFELGKVVLPVRTRMLGHLQIIDPELGDQVEAALGMEGEHDTITPARKPVDLPTSDMLSLVKKAEPTIEGRKVGVLVADGSDRAVVEALRARLSKEGCKLAVVAPKAGGAVMADGKKLVPDHALSSGPSVFFDAVAIVLSTEGAATLVGEAAAIDWVRDAFGHLKVIAHDHGAAALLAEAGVEPDEGVVPLDGAKSIGAFIAAAKQQRIWDREPQVRSPG